MKGIRSAWGIAVVVCVSAGVCAAAPSAGAASRRVRNDVVAVVLTGTATEWLELSVAYPGAVGEARASEDIATLAEQAGWRVRPPALAVGKQDTQATSRVEAGGDTEALVWAAVWALRRFTRITLAVVSPHAPPSSGRSENRFTSAVWSGGGGLWSCDVTIKDRGFRSAAELAAERQAPVKAVPPAARKAREPERSSDSFRRSGAARMALVGALALVAGAAAYLLVARSIRRAPPSC